jgi:hypothetical protein
VREIVLAATRRRECLHLRAGQGWRRARPSAPTTRNGLSGGSSATESWFSSAEARAAGRPAVSFRVIVVDLTRNR